jgi:RNA polymerase sigma-70 factor (ECF subfamily)
MQATEAYAGGEQTYAGTYDACIGETRTREMRDVLSRYLPSFYRAAYRHLGNMADAEDVVQDALLSAYRHLDQFQGQAQMSTWLSAIGTNCARMKLRRRPRQVHLSLDEQFGEGQRYSLSERLADHRPTPEDEYRESELHRRLMQFVAQLSPRLREVLKLRDLDGLTTTETADLLGVAEGTVKARVVRARAKLQRLMRRTLDVQPRSAFDSHCFAGGEKLPKVSPVRIAIFLALVGLAMAIYLVSV